MKKLFQYIVLYLSGLWLLFRRTNRKRLLILMYHGVVPEDVNIWTQVPAAEFEKQMKYLSEKYHVVSLEEAIDMLAGKKHMPDYSAVITFDDGFANNYTIAYPILKKYHLPATIFLSTSIIDDTNDYQGLLWPDYITCLLRTTEKKELDLTDIGLWKESLGTAEKRDEAVNKICEYLKMLSNREKLSIIGKITERAEVAKLGDTCQLYRGLSWDDVREMDAEGVIAFGAHTVNHPILSKLEDSEIKREILESQAIIGEKLGKDVPTFAYPNGKKSDYNAYAKEIASSHFVCALTTIEGLNTVGDDLYELKRVGPGNKTTIWQFKLLISQAITIYYRLIRFLK